MTPREREQIMKSKEFIEEVCETVVNLSEAGERQLKFSPNNRDTFIFGSVPPNSPNSREPEIVVIADFKSRQIRRILPLNISAAFRESVKNKPL